MSKLVSHLFHIIKTSLFGPEKLRLPDNSLYCQSTPPEMQLFGRKFQEGDVWLDTADSGRMYVWDGTGWVPSDDQLVG